MDGSWHIIKWIWGTVCFIWIMVQVVALKRLKGDLKRRSLNVFWMVFVPLIVSDFIRDVFENPEATRVARLVVGVVAVVATVFLIRLLLSKADQSADAQEGNGAESIQPLKLS